MQALPPTRRPALPPQSCSVGWDRQEAPIAGTAAQARFWVALEQPGAWGRQAFTGSRLDPAVGGALEASAAAAGGRALLMRGVGDSRDPDPARPRRVYVAAGMPVGAPWLLGGWVDDPADLLGLPFDELAGGGPEAAEAVQRVLPGLGRDLAGALLVCTNGKRDVCCALRGLPLAAAARERRPGRVWECTHTGGHRFAPTGIHLPTGLTVGRMTDEIAVAVIDAGARGQAPAWEARRHDRGLAHLAPIEQAAHSHVRDAVGIAGLTALAVTGVDDAPRGALVHVAHRDGRAWRVAVATHQLPPMRASCTAEPTTATAFTAQILD